MYSAASHPADQSDMPERLTEDGNLPVIVAKIAFGIGTGIPDI